MTAIELRLAFYGLLLAAIAGGLLYERHHVEAQLHAEDKAAATAQHQQDTATNQGIVDENTRLKQQLAASPVVSSPPPLLRVCVPTHFVSAGPASQGTQPGIAPAGGGNSGVPDGAEATASIDIGGVVQDLALAGMLRATNGDLLYEWAVNQAKETSR
jgi:hypothetical protein